MAKQPKTKVAAKKVATKQASKSAPKETPATPKETPAAAQEAPVEKEVAQTPPPVVTPAASTDTPPVEQTETPKVEAKDEAPANPPEKKEKKEKDPDDKVKAKVKEWAEKNGLTQVATEQLLDSVPSMVKEGLVWQNTDGTRDFIKGANDSTTVEKASRGRQAHQRFLWNAVLAKS